MDLEGVQVPVDHRRSNVVKSHFVKDNGFLDLYIGIFLVIAKLSRRL